MAVVVGVSLERRNMSDPSKPLRRADVVHSVVLDEMVLYCQATSQAVSLNHSARAIWELCDGEHSSDEICHDLSRWTGIPAAELSEDVKSTLSQFEALHLVET